MRVRLDFSCSSRYVTSRWRKVESDPATTNSGTEAQFVEQWTQHDIARPPPSDRALIDGLANLDSACRLDRPLRLVKGEAGIIPFEAAIRDYTARLRLEIGDELLIADVQNQTGRQHCMPMIHQPRIGAVITPEFAQVVSELLRCEKNREAGEAGINGIATGMDDARIG